LEQERVVEAHPPDAARVNPVVDQMADGLVERRCLADTARPEDELIAVRIVDL